MLRTILLLDGSAIMNSAADYLPSYCLALRTPVLQCVAEYLDGTPLATMGVVVMRDGVSRRLAPCTSNMTEIADTLERDFFMVGGSGVLSLENGLRMAMSELADLRKVRAANKSGNAAGKITRDPTRLRVLLLSASVTLIDPTDVFAVLKLMAQLGIEIHCVSLCGAVHVFEEAARMTGGTMHCPLNYGHLQGILHQLALQLAVEGRGHRTSSRGTISASHAQKRRRVGENSTDDVDITSNSMAGESVDMIPIGFPEYVNKGVKVARLEDQKEEDVVQEEEVYLLCPQCHLVQTAVPTTCRLCRLQLCSVPILYSGFVRQSQHTLLPRTITASTQKKTRTDAAVPASASSASVSAPQPALMACRCSACQQPLLSPKRVAASTTGEPTEDGSSRSTQNNSGGEPVQCVACHAWRCASCHVYVVEHLGLCPTCLTSL